MLRTRKLSKQRLEEEAYMRRFSNLDEPNGRHEQTRSHKANTKVARCHQQRHSCQACLNHAQATTLQPPSRDTLARFPPSAAEAGHGVTCCSVWYSRATAAPSSSEPMCIGALAVEAGRQLGQPRELARSRALASSWRISSYFTLASARGKDGVAAGARIRGGARWKVCRVHARFSSLVAVACDKACRVDICS